MISVEQALEKVLSNIHHLGEEERASTGKSGQVLAEDVYSQINVPPRDNSALDGYAVKSSDIKNCGPQNPCILKVIDIIVAGDNPRKTVVPGTAITDYDRSAHPSRCGCGDRF